MPPSGVSRWPLAWAGSFPATGISYLRDRLAGGIVDWDLPWPDEGRQPNRMKEEAAMEVDFVWVTTRRIRPGTLEEFETAWRPAPSPQGLRRTFAYWSCQGAGGSARARARRGKWRHSWSECGGR
ncbi:hypothetical protein GCM10027074_77660 [Streptomyces deserti]